MKDRITILLGAGAAIPIGGPRTDYLTNLIQRKDKKNDNPNFVKQLFRILRAYYNPSVNQAPNFEDIFHTIEVLISYKTSQQRNAKKSFKLPIGAFLRKERGKFTKIESLNRAKVFILETIMDEIEKYQYNLRPNWYESFWKDLEKDFYLDIFSLNYDITVNQILLNSTDGFSKSSQSSSPFDPINLYSHLDRHRICNLHGSIFLGNSSHNNYNSNFLYLNTDDLWKYNVAQEARANTFYSSNIETQSGHQVARSSIIVGLQKTDKIINYPFSEYSSLFSQSIRTNSKLIIIGYSFGDLYINSLLEKFNYLHKDSRRAIVIDYTPNSILWNLRAHIMRWPSQRMISALFRIFNQQYPVDGYPTKPSFIRSKDNRALIFLNGFEDAVKNHFSEMLNLLR
ncbi:SIR2 family protein [Leptospira stimsonii]|nr:SIR2 family protein [Leptospira stimsonii]